MKIAVYGAGGVGGYFGGRLAESGQDVTFIARGVHLDAIRHDGLQVASPKGDFVVHPAAATDDPSKVGLVDLVLVGVKAGQISDIGSDLRSMIGPETVVVPSRTASRRRRNWSRRLAQIRLWAASAGSWRRSQVRGGSGTTGSNQRSSSVSSTARPPHELVGCAACSRRPG